jgi:hypothetical protein
MSNAPHPTRWQDIGWNGIVFKVPSSWQPTVIYATNLFFEEEGSPVFEIKWQKIQGKFSLQDGLKQLQKTLPEDASLVANDLQPDLHRTLFTNTASGFQIEYGNRANDGIIIFCAECNHVILIQWYFNTEINKGILTEILQSLQDHVNNETQLLAVYDIKAKIPCQAALQSHEFLPGKYTVCFELGATVLTLYRFKPAAIILKNSSLGQFGQEILSQRPEKEDKRQASWNYRLNGLNALLAKLRRKPTSTWMRLWYNADQNAILGVKAVGNNLTETSWLEHICEHFMSINNE